VAVHRILVEPALPLDAAGHEPGEVLVVSTDPDVLAEAGRQGFHRLVADAREQGALDELVGFLDRA
jgi:hypothetical protein